MQLDLHVLTALLDECLCVLQAASKDALTLEELAEMQAWTKVCPAQAVLAGCARRVCSKPHSLTEDRDCLHCNAEAGASDA